MDGLELILNIGCLLIGCFVGASVEHFVMRRWMRNELYKEQRRGR